MCDVFIYSMGIGRGQEPGMAPFRPRRSDDNTWAAPAGAQQRARSVRLPPPLLLNPLP
jgi:hypothetical protein